MNTKVKAKGDEQLISEKIKILSVERLQKVHDFVGFLEFRQQRDSKSRHQDNNSKSFLAVAQKYAVCVDGGRGDLCQ